MWDFGEFLNKVDSGEFQDYNGDWFYSTDTKESNLFVNPSDIKAGIYRNDFNYVTWYKR